MRTIFIFLTFIAPILAARIDPYDAQGNINGTGEENLSPNEREFMRELEAKMIADRANAMLQNQTSNGSGTQSQPNGMNSSQNNQSRPTGTQSGSNGTQSRPSRSQPIDIHPSGSRLPNGAYHGFDSYRHNDSPPPSNFGHGDYVDDDFLTWEDEQYTVTPLGTRTEPSSTAGAHPRNVRPQNFNGSSSSSSAHEHRSENYGGVSSSSNDLVGGAVEFGMTEQEYKQFLESTKQNAYSAAYWQTEQRQLEAVKAKSKWEQQERQKAYEKAQMDWAKAQANVYHQPGENQSPGLTAAESKALNELLDGKNQELNKLNRQSREKILHIYKDFMGLSNFHI